MFDHGGELYKSEKYQHVEDGTDVTEVSNLQNFNFIHNGTKLIFNLLRSEGEKGTSSLSSLSTPTPSPLLHRQHHFHFVSL